MKRKGIVPEEKIAAGSAAEERRGERQMMRGEPDSDYW